MKAKVGAGLFIGVATGLAAAAAVELTRPRSAAPGRVVDWDHVRSLAQERVGDGEILTAERRRSLEQRYAEFAAEMRGPVFEAVGETRDLQLPVFEALDRSSWIDVNLGILQRVIDPLTAMGGIPDNRLVDFGRAGVDRYTALLLSFLATRVLGQFDPQLMGREPVTGTGEHALYLVETNVRQWEEEAKLPADDLRRWLILHEMTHAWQFGAHPWLPEYLNSALRKLLELAGSGNRSSAARLLALTVGLPSQLAMLKQVQAAMTLIEGYSNLVMNLAGRRVLTTFEQLEEAYRRRQREKSVLEELFWRLTGLDLKLQQYRRGEQFSRQVYEGYGMPVLNLAWEGAENMPTLAELGRPEDWVARVTGRRRGVQPSPA